MIDGLHLPNVQRLTVIPYADGSVLLLLELEDGAEMGICLSGDAVEQPAYCAEGRARKLE